MVTMGHASNPIPIVAGELLTLTVASDDITPIRIIGERIQNIRGTADAFATTTDNGGSLLDSDSGIFFLKPYSAFQDKPFSLILTTENNATYTLRINPEDKLATPVNLTPQAVNEQAALRWEQSSPYVTTLTSLLKSLANNEAPAGFSIQPLKKLSPVKLNTHTWATLLQVIQGKKLRAEIHYISHHHEDEVMLSPQQFNSPSTLAVMFKQPTLSGHSQTYAYKVVRNDRQ